MADSPEISDPRPKKPSGWHSREQKEARRLEAAKRRRDARRAKAARIRRRRRKIERLRDQRGAFAEVATRKVERINAVEASRPAPPKAKKRRHGRRATTSVVVARPHDTVTALYKRGVINGRAAQAAEKYRECYDIVSSHGMTGTLSPDRGSGSSHGRAKPERVMVASEMLNVADRLLGQTDARVIHEVVVSGRSIEEIAAMLRGRVTRTTCDVARERIRDGLNVLADAWMPPSRRRESTILSTRSADAKPHVMPDEKFSEIERQRVAHASTSGVVYGAQKIAGSRRHRADG